jgi:hypothetical protein
VLVLAIVALALLGCGDDKDWGASGGKGAGRFEDLGDGTVMDDDTGLQWEKKTDDDTVHDVDFVYSWSTGAPWDPDGTAFTDFLDDLNTAPCFAGHCDWRLPQIADLQTILIGPDAAPGQDANCSAAPCIDPEFAAVGGPTASSDYWSVTEASGGRPRRGSRTSRADSYSSTPRPSSSPFVRFAADLASRTAATARW